MSELADRVRSLLDHDLLARAGTEQLQSVARRPDASQRELMDGVAAELEVARPDGEERVRVTGVLGSGGMGVVHRGEQTALGRDVAVKTLKPACKDEENTLRLLQEAWVTGSLEHPNVLPVYDIAVDREHGPLVVLKRIAGRTWTELLEDEALARETAETDDLLGWHMRVLIQACYAVELAHERGILHRDLKPDNIMVGEFGEVYVLDWGLAVSTEPRKSSRIPSAEADEVAGTPAYMAPEMFGGDLPTRATDVYLLGGMLHEIVTGKAPNQGATLLEIVSELHNFAPDFGDPTLKELERTCAKALSFEQGERHQSVREFRRELELFLQRRGATQLLERANGSLAELQDELSRSSRLPGEDLSSLDDAAREYRQRIYNLFGECRFGFREVLRSWPDNDTARLGLNAAVTTVVQYELQEGEPRAALALLSELQAPDDLLRARVEAALVSKARDQEKLEQLAEIGRAQDPRRGLRGRVMIVLIMGMLWTATRLAAGLSGAVFTSHGSFVGSQFVFLIALLGLGYWQRAAVTHTSVNMAIFRAAVVGTAAMIAVHAGAVLSGMPVEAAMPFDMLVIACAIGVLAVSRDLGLWPAAAAFVAAFLVSSRWPAHGFYALAGADLALTLNAVAMWWPREGDE